jgi:Fe2+ or Zn2+ uptake regulation protein
MLCKVVAVKSPTELVDLFRSEGLKATPQRDLVFRLLHNNPTHPTAEAIYSAAAVTMPTISLKTVYQILNDLRELGEIQSLDFATGATRFDPNIGDHHHLVCRHCGAIFDVHIDDSDLSLPQSQRHGFVVDDVEVTFRGLCAQCCSNNAPNQRV